MKEDKTITKEILENELKRYKLLREVKRSNDSYYGGKIAVVKNLLKIIDEGYKETKERYCPYRKIGDYAFFCNCIEKQCQMWDIEKNDCGLKQYKP